MWKLDIFEDFYQISKETWQRLKSKDSFCWEAKENEKRLVGKREEVQVLSRGTTQEINNYKLSVNPWVIWTSGETFSQLGITMYSKNMRGKFIKKKK